MPTIEKIVSQSNTDFVGRTSRYLSSDLISYEVGGVKFVTFKTFKRPSRQASPDDKFYVITKGAEYRPDIVARQAYGEEGFWWCLLLANGMKDITEFVAGTTIVIPSPYF